VDDNPTQSDLIAADEQAQEAADQLAKAAAIEKNHRLWLTAITPILVIDAGNLPPYEEVRDALNATIVAACERARRILKSDLPASR